MKKIFQFLMFGKPWPIKEENNIAPRGTKVTYPDEKVTYPEFCDGLQKYHDWHDRHEGEVLQVPITKLSSLHEYYAKR